MKIFAKVIIVCFWGQSHLLASSMVDFQTTRLVSTGGAGIGSVLMNESAILNPASLAFFNVTSLYMQRDKFQQEHEGDKPHKTDPRQFNSFIIADGKSTFKGALGYLKKEREDFTHSAITASFSQTMMRSSSMGVSYRRIKSHPTGKPDEVQEENQFVVGTTHVGAKNFSIGAIWVDPFEKRPDDVLIAIGGQYIISNILALLADVGVNYKLDFPERYFWKVGAQVNVFSNYFLRVGHFDDRRIFTKGTGLGVGVVTPKLVIDGAMRITKKYNSPANEQIKNVETSISAGLAI